MDTKNKWICGSTNVGVRKLEMIRLCIIFVYNYFSYYDTATRRTRKLTMRVVVVLCDLEILDIGWKLIKIIRSHMHCWLNSFCMLVCGNWSPRIEIVDLIFILYDVMLAVRLTLNFGCIRDWKRSNNEIYNWSKSKKEIYNWRMITSTRPKKELYNWRMITSTAVPGAG